MKRYLKTLLALAVGATLAADAGAAPPMIRGRVMPGQPAVQLRGPAHGRDPFREQFEKIQLVEMVISHCISQGIEDRHPGLEFGMPSFDPFFMPPAGDMELLDVQLVAAGEQGPLYQVSLRNNSPYAAKHFSVSLVAALGEIDEDSPVVTLDIKRLGAGDTATVEVQLPAAVLAMGSARQPLVMFDTLFVAIDSFDELVETNEFNNVVKLVRTEIAAVEAVAVAPAVAAEVAPAPEAEAAPAPDAGAAPAPGPESKIDLDTLDLDDAEETVPATPSAPATIEASPADAPEDDAPDAAPAVVDGAPAEASSLFIR